MKRKAIIGGVVALAFFIGIGAGAASKSAPDPTKTAAYRSLVSKSSGTEASLRSQLAQAQATITADTKTIGNLPAEQAQVKAELAKVAAIKSAAHAQVEAELAKVAAIKSAAAAHASVVNAEYNRIENNTLSGDGVYLAGTDMRPGTYRTKGTSGCYYQVSSDPNGNNIIANGNPDGSAFVSVQRGQYLTLERCDDWILQR